MSINPNERLRDYLQQGSAELRSFIEQNIISGDLHELDRLERYYLNWKFYNGYHYREYNHNLISFNYVKAFIDKVNLFLLGDAGFTFKVTSYYNDVVDEEIEKPIEEYILYTWRRNNLSVTAHEILQTGGICGDVWLMPYWEEVKKFVKIRVLDSRHCFPIFKDGDISKLESFQVRIPLQDHNAGYKVKVYNYTNNSVEEWYQKSASVRKAQLTSLGLYEGKFPHGEDVYEYATRKNELGFIPIVHIKNRPQADSYYGKSDIHDILKLNKVYNELAQELKGIIDYYATPTTVVTGATLKNMTRGLGKVWSGLPPEANVFTLGLDADLSEMINFMNILKTAMHEISDVPENVLGKIQAISGTSAAALKLTYQPLVQQADLKAMTYGDGIAEINDMIIRIALKFDKKNKRLKGIEFDDEGGDIRVIPVFPYGFPTDRMQLLQELQYEIPANLTSKRAAMNRLGVNNVPDLMREIETERIAEAALQSELAKLTAPPEIPVISPDSGKNTSTDEDETDENEEI